MYISQGSFSSPIFRASAVQMHTNSSFVSDECRPHVTIVVQECGRADLVPIQYSSLEAFLDDDFDYNVVVCNSPLSSLTALSAFAATHPNVHTINCPAEDLATCYDFSYRFFVNERGNATFVNHYLMFANVDMFLWRRFSVHGYLQRRNADVSAVVETHSGPPYIHPGIVLLKASKIAGRFATNWQGGKGDVGSETATYLASLATDKTLVFSPMIWSRAFDFHVLRDLKLIPIELFDILSAEKASCPNSQGCLVSDLYFDDFSILHPRGSSNWQGEAGLDARSKKIFNFVNSRISGDILTWSTIGSTTSNGDLNDLFGPAYQHTIGNALEYSPIRFAEPFAERFSLGTFPTVVPATPLSQADENWLLKIYDKADEYNQTIVFPKILSLQATGSLLPLPAPSSGMARINTNHRPPRYDHELYLKSKVYYWNFVYNGSSDSSIPDAQRNCQKKSGQRFWAATFAVGAKRERIAEEFTKRTCIDAGFDHFLLVRETDLPEKYRTRNAAAFSHQHGVGMWIWKSYVQYLTMGRMNDGDILFYLDSDMGCSPHMMQYLCLAQNADVVPFHHSNPWYTMSRFVRRDAMVFMDMDRYEVAQSVQYSGGTVLMRKTPRALEYVTSLAAWAQVYPVLCCFGASSVYSVDYPEYDEAGKRHQCDQAVSSLLITKFAFKSYPWDLGGFGAGSDDEQNYAQRLEAGLDENNIRIDMAR